MPYDPSDSCAVSVHYYTPSTFCILTEDTDWGKARADWGNDADIQELQANMAMVKERFIDNGIPVIIGEYGVATANKASETVNLFITSVCDEALKIGACPVLWSVTDEHYDRTNYRLYNDDLQSQFDELNERYGKAADTD